VTDSEQASEIRYVCSQRAKSGWIWCDGGKDVKRPEKAKPSLSTTHGDLAEGGGSGELQGSRLQIWGTYRQTDQSASFRSRDGMHVGSSSRP